jgi:ribosomal protein S8
MNFRVSIKQILAHIRVAEKKKDLKVIIGFKKELIPFLLALRQEGVIYKFVVQKDTIVLCLKKVLVVLPRAKQKERVIRDFGISAILYKNPAALVFLSTTFGVCTKGFAGLQFGRKKIGGSQLFLIP